MSSNAIGFGDVDSSHRLWPVATHVDASAELAEVIREPLFVLRHRYPIDPRAGLPLLSSKRPKQGVLVDVVQQGCEPGLGSLLGRRVHPSHRLWPERPMWTRRQSSRRLSVKASTPALACRFCRRNARRGRPRRRGAARPGLGSLLGRRVHPFEVRRQGNPALCPDPGLFARAPLRLVPSLHASRFLRRLHRYYGSVRLPTSARTAALAVACRCPPLETNPTDPVGPLMFR
ncbi:hypothetical protein ACVWXO_000964 [Bradyrhizobium sp. LM2.7]